MSIVKPFVVLVAGSATATGAYLTKGYWLSTPKDSHIKKSISKVLSESKYSPLDTTQIDKWNSVLEKYKTANPSSFKEVSKLQDYCRDLLSKEEYSSSDYREARRWCVEEQSATTRLGFFDRSALSTDATTNDTQWKTKIEQHKSSSSSNKLKHTFSAADDQNLKDIKEKCSGLSKKTNTDDTFESDFDTFLEWCSIDKPNAQ
ncbi:hypothetical protein MHC_04650 [Mycoplasma haemocanis str. Illinois]|uniref:Uncharacterized protein n=1 Tax=Mycoplasma haemocanis (strain Illinois) TaxID=1111676 RepID=H6N814_MYCHN|nr:hypothetical protein [Mycoplasma haemocanis]AEW45786.1 hypothetical protein MHC_04650 [Mycoplasma haemocanis str. Illinois]